MIEHITATSDLYASVTHGGSPERLIAPLFAHEQ